MKSGAIRVLSILLCFALCFLLLPDSVFAETEINSVVHSYEAPKELTRNDYAAVDIVFDQIAEMESSHAKKNSAQSQLTEAAAAIVKASDSYVEGSLKRNGDSFTWKTQQGIRCLYSPRMQKINREMVASAEPLTDGVYNEPVSTKGGWPSGNQVYLVGPYYGYDSDFTDQYKNEAQSIARAIGDTDGYTLYSGKSATVDKVAEAVSKGAVVIFDSHGDTNYANGDDYVSGASSSYLCLTSTSGLTSEDYDDGALYYADGICINGATIANHMTSNSPGGILWMAICLGMATDTMCQPLREMGVEVVCGYSQSVTFAGDYLFEETFWDNLCGGSTVAAASAAMKARWGEWDWSTKIANYYGYNDGYVTISEARENYSAFPVVVSDEDPHPGQRNRNTFYGADSLQTVKSTYTLFTQYDLRAVPNDNAFGDVSVSGNVITALPAEGYFAQGYTITSGSASVTQNGNNFVIYAQSDCTVQINFAPKTRVTVSFAGAQVVSQAGYAGDIMKLPSASAPDGFSFVGWTPSPLTADTTEKPGVYGASFIPNGDTILYALYSYVDEDSGTGTGDYVKVTSRRDDWSGEYLIVYEADGLILDSTLSTMDASGNYQEVTISGGTISAEQGDPYKFLISEYNGGYAIQGQNGLYIGCSSNANLLNSGGSKMKNTISLDASGNANIIGSGGAYLRYNLSASRFRYYKTSSYSNQKPVALYLKDGSAGTTYYTGNPVKCEHIHTENVAAVAATCDETGFTAGVFCMDCQSYISGRVTVEALGHSYSQQVTPPTATQQGYTLFTCGRCGSRYQADFVPALGETYRVSFVVPSGVSAIAPMNCNLTGITLPTAGAPAGETAYSFLGWTTAPAEDLEQLPAVVTGHYVAKEDTVLYALYSYTVGGVGTGEFVLTDLSEIQPTDKVVITVDYKGTVYAMNHVNGTGDAPDGVIVSVSNDNGVTKLDSEPEESLIWNIGGSEGAYIIYPNGTTSEWLYCKTINNGVRVGCESSQTFSIVDDYLYNNGTGRYIGVYRTNPDWRCYTSINANISGQILGFFVQGEPGMTYYTTLDAGECRHQAVTYSFVNNVHTFTCTTCGQVAFTKAEGKQFKINSAAPVLGEDIALNYRVTLPAGFENAYMVFEMNGSSTVISDGILNTTGATAGQTSFIFPGINPLTIGDNICATLYAYVDGYEVSLQIPEFSVLKYCDGQLQRTNDANLRTILSDVLVYGAKAQIYSGYKTDALVTDRVSAGVKLTPSTFQTLDSSYNLLKVTGDKNADIDYKNAALVLGSKVKVKYGINCTNLEADYVFKINVGGEEFTYTTDDLVADENGNLFLEFDKLRAIMLGEKITATIWDGDTQVGRTVEYSVYTYVQMNQNSSNTALRELLQSIYNYGESAKKA